MEHINSIEMAKDLIKKEFHFLEQKGYRASFKIIPDNTFIECLAADYKNTQVKRIVHIGYSKDAVYDDIKYTFNVSIKKIPNNDLTDYFWFSMYLNSINESINTSMVNYFDENEAGDILKKLSSALKYHAADIIDGTKWLGDFWPRW